MRVVCSLIMITIAAWQNEPSCRSTCSNCAAPSPPLGDPSPFKKCGGCGVRKYCGKRCQLADWKNGHKAICGNQAAGAGGMLLQHTPACAYAYNNPKIEDSHFAEMGQLLVVNSSSCMRGGSSTTVRVVAAWRIGAAVVGVLRKW